MCQVLKMLGLENWREMKGSDSFRVTARDDDIGK